MEVIHRLWLNLVSFPNCSPSDSVGQPELPARGRRLAGQVHLPRLRLPGARRDVAPQRPPDQPGQRRRRESGVLEGQNGKCRPSFLAPSIRAIGCVRQSPACSPENGTSPWQGGSTFRHQVIPPEGGISNVSTAREGQLERMRGGGRRTADTLTFSNADTLLSNGLCQP